MANGITAACAWRLIVGGSDTANTGGFDPGTTVGISDLACTTGTTGSATTSVTSATAAWVSGDTNSWLFIQSGTSWNAGWYQFTFVSSSSGTIDTRAGKWAAWRTGGSVSPSTVDGCGTTASLSSGAFTMDYSQQTAAAASWTTVLAYTTGTGAIASTGGTAFRPTMIGNVIAISTTYVVVTAYTSSVLMTGNTAGTTVGAGANGFLGGALASIGLAGSLHIVGNTLWPKYSATPYSSTSTTSNVTNGRFSSAGAGTATAPITIRGYDQVLGDETANRPTIRWGINAASNPIIRDGSNGGLNVENCIVDGNRANFTATAGISMAGNNCTIRRVKIMNCSAAPLAAAGNHTSLDLELANNTAIIAIAANANVSFRGLYVHDQATTGVFTISTGSINFEGFIAANCAGGDFLASTGASAVRASNGTVYNTTGSAFSFSAAPNVAELDNVLFTTNSAYGINPSGVYPGIRTINCAYYLNTSGKYQNAPLQQNIVGEIVPLVDPLTAPGSGDFSLNTAATGGALLASSGYPQTYPGLTFLNYPSVGAAQPKGSSGILTARHMSGGVN